MLSHYDSDVPHVNINFPISRIFVTYFLLLEPISDSFSKQFDGKRNYSSQKVLSEDDDGITDTSDDKDDKKMKYDEDTPQEVVEKRKERNRVLARKTRYSFNSYIHDTKPSH